MSWVITGSQKVNWDPSLISTALWLDAADSTTVTADGSNLVSQVNDKSGNGRNFTSSSTARPTYSASTLNSKAVFTFGGSQHLTSASAASTWNFMHTTGGCTFWLVGKAGSVSNPQTEYFLLGNNAGASSNIGHLFYYSDIDNGGGKNNDLAVDFVTRGQSGTFNTLNLSTNNALAANAPFLASVARDPGNATAAERSTIYINGSTPIKLNTSTGVASSANATHALQIGAAGNNAAPLTGYISEIIITSSIATTDTRQRIEGYLAHKWGLTANLPNDHPFKVNVPAP
jgi:hypothetical protein